MARASREAVRDVVATLLEATLVNGSPKVAQAVYNHQKVDFEESPVVLVFSDGVERPRGTLVGGTSTFYLMVATFVTLVASGSYTEADAEDRLDLVEQKIAEVFTANRSTDDWTFIDYDGRSQILDVEVGGTPYSTEVIPVRVEVFG